MWPLELTATPDTSPKFIPAGSLKKSATESNGISGTVCCASDGVATSMTSNINRAFMVTSTLAVPSSKFRVPGSGFGFLVRPSEPQIKCGTNERTMQNPEPRTRTRNAEPGTRNREQRLSCRVRDPEERELLDAPVCWRKRRYFRHVKIPLRIGVHVMKRAELSRG